VGALGLSPPAWSANRFLIGNQSLAAGSTGNIVAVNADLDQDIYAFSVHIGFDAAKIRVTLLQLGAAVSSVSPEYSQGTVTNGPGDIVHGVVFDTSDPITKKLAAGAGKEVLKLTVDVLASSGTAVLDLVNVPGTPSRLNVMADLNGNPAPGLTLVDGTLTFSASNPPPEIQSFTDNSGAAGKQFLVVGLNFDKPGLAVTVCAKAATFALLGDNQTISVTAPACASGPAEVKICTNFGCDSDPAGFTYTGGGGTTFVRGNSNNDAKVDLSDAVAILNFLFGGIPHQAPCRDALDTNDSGGVDLSDAIYLLQFLFLGGPDVKPPYPAAGLDPTADGLPGC
jgi:hypothetical protein